MKLHYNLFSKALNGALDEGGGTFNIETAEAIDKNEGYMVGIKDITIVKESHLKKYTAGQLEDRFMYGLKDFNLNIENLYVGSWLDDGSIYFDLSVWVKDRSFSVRLGDMFKQKAIYDLKNKESIYLNEEEEKRLCEHCGEEVHEGHYMFEDFYLCTDCFDKFYDGNMAEYMYDEELQFYTEWESESQEEVKKVAVYDLKGE